MTPFTRVACVSLIAMLVVSLAGPALAQESKSATLARQLTAALDAGKLDCIAAKDPSAPDAFVGDSDLLSCVRREIQTPAANVRGSRSLMRTFTDLLVSGFVDHNRRALAMFGSCRQAVGVENLAARRDVSGFLLALNRCFHFS